MVHFDCARRKLLSSALNLESRPSDAMRDVADSLARSAFGFDSVRFAWCRSA